MTAAAEMQARGLGTMTGMRPSVGLTGERGTELAPEINSLFLFRSCLPSTLCPEPKLWSWAEELPSGAGV